MLRLLLRAGVSALAVCVCIGTADAAGIAVVTDVVNAAFRTPPGADEQPAQIKDELVQDELLRTDAESTIAVQFIDGSQMSLEPESELVLSSYVFDASQSSSSGLMKLGTGLFQFSSNGIDDEGVELESPVATIGIRGTTILIAISPSGVTQVDVVDGAIEVKPKGVGKSGWAEAGQSILVVSPDHDAQVGAIGDFSTAAGITQAASTSSSGNGDGFGKNMFGKFDPPDPPSPPDPPDPPGPPDPDKPDPPKPDKPSPPDTPDPVDQPDPPSPPDPPEPPAPTKNRSGQQDGSNPSGHFPGGSDNGGTGNPGGGNKGNKGGGPKNGSLD
jgi:hypothetical protein